MDLHALGLDALRSLVVLALSALALRVLRGASASVRRLVLVSTFAALVALPLSSRAGDLLGWRGQVSSDAVTAFAEPLVEASDAPPAVSDLPSAEPSFGSADSAATPAIAWRSTVASAIVVFWALGAILVLARAMWARIVLRGIVQRARPAGVEAVAALEAASSRIGASAEVLVSDEVDVPAVAGIVRPIVLLPPSARDWGREQWMHVLLHELAHVRQRDVVGLALAQLGSAIYWYNPLVWWARRRLEDEREGAADERVLAAGALPSAYARTLLDVVVEAARPGPLASGSIAVARGGVAGRIEAIVNGAAKRPPSARVGWFLAIGALAVGVGPGCVGAANGVSSRDGSATKTQEVADRAGPPTPLTEDVAAAVGAPASELELTIDPRLQTIADEELARVKASWSPRSATAIVIDPSTGQVLALSGVDLAKRNLQPGSTFKLLSVAAAIEGHTATADTRFDCGMGSRDYGSRKLSDAGAYGELTVREIVATSSNVGASRIFDSVGGAQLTAWLERAGMVAASPVELSGLEHPTRPGTVEAGTVEGAHIAIGHKMAVSPLHLGALYAAIANGGELPRLSLVRSIGKRSRSPEPKRRIFSEETAATLRSLLDSAVNDEKATGKKAQVAGVRIGGKTGTSGQTQEDTLASFIGLAPIDAPRYVVVVSVLGAKGEATGGSVAAPAFARILARSLGQP